jgi:hypothetical protein
MNKRTFDKYISFLTSQQTGSSNKEREQQRRFLFERGNVGLARCLLAIYDAGPEGISTYKLLHELGSTNHGQAFIRRAAKEGLIERIKGERSEHGHFPPVLNRITEKARQLLKASMPQ